MRQRNAEVMWVARYDYPPEWQMKIPHKHDYYQIIYILDGHGEIFIDGEHYDVAAERFFFFHPYHTHQLFCDAKSGLKTLDIKFLIHSLRLREELEGAGVMLDTKELDVQTVFRRIRQESREKAPYFREFIDLRLEEMLYIIARLTIQSRQEHTETPDEGLVAEPDEDVCQKTITYIKQHYSEEISLRSMAAEVGYNPSYICQMFKKRLQNTPTNYLYGYRLKKAKELIIYSDFSLKQIANLTGFKNIHHFTRTFHNLEGVAPGHWRKLEKEGIGKGVFLKAQFTNKNFLREEKSDS